VVFKREPSAERIVDFIARFLADGSDEDDENAATLANKDSISRSKFSITVIRFAQNLLGFFSLPC